MNDRTIINTISKIYFIIVSFLSFIFLLFSLTFIVLQHGIYIDNISLENIKIKQLYIKWNEKLNLSVKEATILHKQDESTPIDFEKINLFVQQIPIFNNWFESIIIEKINFNNISGVFHYKDGENGFLTASSPDFSLKSSLFFASNLLHLKLDTFKDFKRKIDIKGDIILDNSNLEVITSLDININNDFSLKLLSYADQKGLLYRVNSLKNIKDITHTMKLLPLHKDVKYWAYEAIKMSHLSIHSVHGWLEYAHIGDAYKNLYVDAVGHNLSYTYNPKLDAIHTQQTDLEFKDGVLNIRPRETSSYGFGLDKSWLNIDFTQKEELLTLYLLFDGKLNKEMLHVLNTYEIKVPFLQNSGTVKTNLKLTVNLQTIGVEAKGDFFTKKANFDYIGLKIDVFDAYILLDNYDVKIENMLASYKEIAHTKVDVVYNAKRGEGTIDFAVKDVIFKEFNLSLDKRTPLNILYTIAPKEDHIAIGNSAWVLKDKVIKVNAIDIPFDLEKLIINLPATFVEIPNITSVSASGMYAFKTGTMNLDIDVLNFVYDGIKLTQHKPLLNLKYDKKLSLTSSNTINFRFNDLACSLEKPRIEIEDNKMDISLNLLNIDDTLHAKLLGNYDFKKNSGFVGLENVKIANTKYGEMYADTQTTNLLLSKSDDNLKITAPALDIGYTQNNEKWSLAINSIDKLTHNSKILQDYNVTSGTLFVQQNISDNYIKFSANIKHPYKFLVQENEPIEEYNIEGKINNTTKKILLTINNSLKINIGEEIKVKMKDMGLNVPSLIDFINTKHTDENVSTDDINDSKSKNITISAKNSYLHISKERNILADTLYLQYKNKTVAAKLIHAKGEAVATYKEDELHLYGENFNDIFMSNFFGLSKFKGGSFDFSVDGTLKEFDGLFYIKDTIMLDYKILNNILAFVNTVPSLVTFSLPGYSSKGLRVSSAYINFHAKDKNLSISDISLDSQEIDIVGKGTADFNNDTIDLLLNLKTNLGSSISQVPLVGHLLLDGNTLSTTLSVNGDLQDPSVSYLVAKDIIVAPLNIIKRVLLLPFTLIPSSEEEEMKEDE